jgi:hypothetical protein
MKSFFTDKKNAPVEAELQQALGKTFAEWRALSDFVKKSSPGAIEEWKFTGEKFGWSFRVRDKKRVLVYFLPRDKFFKVAFVFGQKATDRILASNISNTIKEELRTTRVYAEGRGIRLEIKDQAQIEEIRELIKIKISA